jgi:hypothetical protein
MLDLSRLLRGRRGPAPGGALQGMLAGGALLLVAVGLQLWNEGRTYRREALLADAGASVVMLATPSAMPENDGRLVHVVGDARASAPVVDETFGIEVEGLALRRHVEMYQWREKKTESESNGRKTFSYNYDRVWTNEAIDSDRFTGKAEHVNPGSMPFDEATVASDEVRVGELLVGPDALREIGGWRRMDAASLVLPPNMAVSFRPHDGWLVTSEAAGDPVIGDVRVRFEVMPPGQVSILARQQQGSLVPYENDVGEELLLAGRGKASANELLASAANSNKRAAWAIRFAGFVLAWVGFGLMFRPLTLLADVVPVLGRIAGIGTAIVAGALALALSALAIGGGWMWQRPWLLVAIVALAVVAVAWLLRRRAAPASPMPRSMPPPPPPAAS